MIVQILFVLGSIAAIAWMGNYTLALTIGFLLVFILLLSEVLK